MENSKDLEIELKFWYVAIGLYGIGFVNFVLSDVLSNKNLELTALTLELSFISITSGGAYNFVAYQLSKRRNDRN